MLRPVGGSEGTDEGALSLLVGNTSLGRFGVFHLDDQDLGRLILHRVDPVRLQSPDPANEARQYKEPKFHLH